MPNFNVHRRIGFWVAFITVIAALFFVPMPMGGWKLILILPVVWFYSNLPDLDHHMGKLRKKTLLFVFSIMALSSIAMLFFSIPLMILLLSVTGMLGIGMLQVKHRGPLHTYWFALVASLPCSLIHWFLFALAVSSSFSHIFVDRLFSGLKKKLKSFFHIGGDRYSYQIKIEV